jgi:uncharacterized damage-inducible protein DinB
MAQQPLPLITFYQGWKTYQHNLVETIAPLSSEQLASPVAPHHWTIGMVAQHMLADRVWWFQGWMGEGSPALAPIAHWNPGDEEEQPAHDAAELVAAFESTWQMIEDALARWVPTDLGYVVPQPAFLSEGERKVFVNLTRQWIIWHVLEHEIHHGGELSLALGGLGLPGVYGNA